MGPSFQRTLRDLEGKERQIQMLLRSVQQAQEEETAYQLSFRLAAACEQATLLARALPAYTGRLRAFQEVGGMVCETVPMDIGFTQEGWFCLRIPFLLPKKETGSTAYVRSLVYPSLRRFFQRIPPPRYSPCVLIFRHVYARARPERRFRDHDNIETNMVADAVTLYTMEDDGPRVCSHYACTALGDRERTEVYVVPEGDFPQWLMSEKSMPEEGVVLLEKCPKSAQKDRAKWA